LPWSGYFFLLNSRRVVGFLVLRIASFDLIHLSSGRRLQRLLDLGRSSFLGVFFSPSFVPFLLIEHERLLGDFLCCSEGIFGRAWLIFGAVYFGDDVGGLLALRSFFWE